MLKISIGEQGSYCDNCGAPARKGFELSGRVGGMFFCEPCAERKYGEAETQRAITAAKSIIQQANALLSQQQDVKARPVGFLR